MSGALVCVVGPSGAGKDTMIRGARLALAGTSRVLFPRRLVTRESTEAEDHDTLPPARFLALEAENAFALSWSAHGLHYAIPRSAADAVGQGRVAVCNLSRRAIPQARARFSRVAVVLVTAPYEVLRERLAARGREGGADLATRLARDADLSPPPDLTLLNVGPPAEPIARFARFLEALAREPVPEGAAP